MIVEDDLERDARFSDLTELLHPGDLLVLNETRVIPARLIGRRVPTGGQAELLLLHPAASERYRPDARRWIALAKPARRLREGARIALGDHSEALVCRELDEGAREVEFRIAEPFEAFLERVGRLPLPPYVRADSPQAQQGYQTVFARVPGSVAAPTASLHFTQELLTRIRTRGVEIVQVSLNVGLGTFRPIAARYIADHPMHAETYVIGEPAAVAVNRARREQRRIVAAGTTVVRALEGNLREHGSVTAGEWSTDLFITPGFEFRVVDAMITNFHLPQSSLLLLVSAFVGRERILRAYATAVRRRYRFFSFGDAMLLARAALAT